MSDRKSAKQAETSTEISYRAKVAAALVGTSERCQSVKGLAVDEEPDATPLAASPHRPAAGSR